MDTTELLRNAGYEKYENTIEYPFGVQICEV